uniref:Arrestin C-terminal-like domain-containing protein n=1 Tax=Amphilophus citrinellus TaxID=61819 RepID=A0A3Q0RF88_AMPCI
MSPIKDLKVICIAVNEDGTFSQGDIIVGAVIFRLTKDVKVKSVSLKAKGDASAEWSEGNTKFISHWRYFKVKKYLVEKNDKGRRFYSFQTWIDDMPSSYKGNSGRIVYMFEAKISRSWRWSSEAQKEIKFVSQSCPPTAQLMVNSAVIHVKNDISVKCFLLFISGSLPTVSFFLPFSLPSPWCETLSVVAKICNSSSKDTRPKFKLQQKTVYRCKKHTNVTYKTLFKMVGDIIGPNSEQTVSCQLKIPDDAIPTLHNCEIISVEYDIKV